MHQLAEVQSDAATKKLIMKRSAKLAELRHIERIGAFGQSLMAQYGISQPPPEFETALLEIEQARELHERTHDLSALDNAISIAKNLLLHPACSATPKFFRPPVLGILSALYKLRYRAAYLPEDLEKSIQYLQETLTITPHNSPLRHSDLESLGTCLGYRYERTNRLEDLEEAIQVYEEAIKLLSPDSSDRAMYLMGLSRSLMQHSARTERVEDLDKAIEVVRQAEHLVTWDGPERAKILSNLSIALSDRFEYTHRLEDLEESIQVSREALRITPIDYPDRHSFLNNLAGALYDRYTLEKRPEDIEEATHLSREGIQSSHLTPVERAAALDNFGLLLSARYEQFQRPSDLNEAVKKYQEAVTLLDDTMPSLSIAYQLGQQARWHRVYRGAVKTYLQAATAWPAVAADWRKCAFVVAEGSKSKLFTALLGRGELPIPAAIPSDLAIQEQKLMAELANIDISELTTYGSFKSQGGTISRDIQTRRELADRLVTLWQRMERHGPEAKDYVALRRGDPVQWQQLANLANSLGQKTALVSLFTTGRLVQLFVMRAGWESPQVVEAEMDSEAWQDVMRRFWEEIHKFDSTGRRGESWFRVFPPLLEKASPYLKGATCVVIAPLERLHLLPWRILVERLGESLQQEMTLVTTPTLALTEHLRHRPLRKKKEVMVIGDPMGDLPHAREEARQVAALLKVSPLIGHQATKEAVLANLEEVGLAHFATHNFLAASPLDSGIVLADGVLTARNILERGLHVPEFLTLSGCRSGVSSTLGGDEMAGLSQAMLYAGAQSLLVSLWNVDDAATAYLMSHFYEGWRGMGLDKPTTLWQAMSATRSRPEWAHTYYWGGFTLVGNPH